MQIESIIFATAILFSILRYLFSWIFHQPFPDPELSSSIVVLAVALKFGENKAAKLKSVFQKVKTRFFKK